MLHASAAWILVGAALLVYVVLETIQAPSSSGALTGLVLGLLLGGGITTINIVSARRTMDTTSMTSMMKHTLGGFALMFVGAMILAGLIYVTTSQRSAESEGLVLSPQVTLLSYVGIIFLGFAWQAKLVQGSLGKQDSNETLVSANSTTDDAGNSAKTRDDGPENHA